MSLDLGNAPTAPAPSPSEKQQMRTALGVVETNVRYDSAQGLTSDQKNTARTNIDAVPTARTVNGHALTGNITLSASDVGAATEAQGTDERVPTAVGLTSKFGTVKTPIIDNDRVGIFDSAASNAPKHTLWSSIKTTLKTYFDAFYAATNHSHLSSAISDSSSAGGCADAGKVVIYGANGSIVTTCDTANIIAGGYLGGQYLKISSGGRATSATGSDCNGIQWSANQSGVGGNSLTREIVIDSTTNRFDLTVQRTVNDIVVTSGDNYNHYDIDITGTLTPDVTGQLAFIESTEATATFWGIAGKDRWSSDGNHEIAVSGDWIGLTPYYLKNPIAGTVDSLFPKANFSHTNDANTASRILIYPTIGGVLKNYWLWSNSGSPIWRLSGAGTGDRGGDVVAIGEYILPEPKLGLPLGTFHASPMKEIAESSATEFYYVLLQYTDAVLVSAWNGDGVDPFDATLLPLVGTGTAIANKAVGTSGTAATAAQVIQLVNSSSLGVTLTNVGSCQGTDPVAAVAQANFTGGSVGFLTTTTALATEDRSQLQPDADGIYALTQSPQGIPDKLHNGMVTGDLNVESTVINLGSGARASLRSALGLNGRIWATITLTFLDEVGADGNELVATFEDGDLVDLTATAGFISGAGTEADPFIAQFNAKDTHP